MSRAHQQLTDLPDTIQTRLLDLVTLLDSTGQTEKAAVVASLDRCTAGEPHSALTAALGALRLLVDDAHTAAAPPSARTALAAAKHAQRQLLRELRHDPNALRRLLPRPGQQDGDADG